MGEVLPSLMDRYLHHISNALASRRYRNDVNLRWLRYGPLQ